MKKIKNKILVISANDCCSYIEKEVNEWLEDDWLIERFYTIKENKVIVVLCKEGE